MTESPTDLGLSASIPPFMDGGDNRDRAVVLDPDRYLGLAKTLVADNYNDHHDETETPPLDVDDIYIVWWVKVLNNWKAVLASSVVRGMVWMVSFNGGKSEAYIEIYRKINNVKVPVRRMP
jgi:Family of unknown function (DUF6275)